MASYNESVVLAAQVARYIRGEAPTVGPTVVPVAVWPQANSLGLRASSVLIRPSAACHFAIDAAAETAGLNSAYLAAASEANFVLDPNADTLYFLNAGSSSGIVYLRWIIAG